MKAQTYQALLSDLQALEKKVVQSHIDRARGDNVLNAQLQARHTAAEVGGSLDDYVAMTARRSAVQLLLRTVYVRVLEDLGALEPARIRGDWGLHAFREVAPALGVRAFLRWTFRDLAHDFPALFTPAADEFPLPTEEVCRTIWELWHKEDGRGNLLYAWDPDARARAAQTAAEGAGGTETGDVDEVPGFDSRFLGDLYQDLDGEVRKRFALLQTPDFVERYILDRTLTPALAEFDLEALHAQGETFRLIDPTCGSGHFLIGAFHRLADVWQERGLDPWSAAERALRSVWGCDINPHAVDIAHFRLVLEVQARTAVTDLDRLGHLPIRLRVLDSLIPWELGLQQGELFEQHDRLANYATPDERKQNGAFLSGGFHVVVGNPPYITPKDAQKRDDYRLFWPDSAAGKYALSAPFAERFFVLGTPGGFMGQVTANSFMKRQFGKKVVEIVLPRWDLTGVVDTSNAVFPGHPTPTVILFGRCQPPVRPDIWAVLGKRGEPKRPKVPKNGLVWTAIRDAGEVPDDSSPFVTVAQVARDKFATHPWSLGGGPAAELTEALVSSPGTRALSAAVDSIGVDTITRASALLELEYNDPRRHLWSQQDLLKPYVLGDGVRDFFCSTDVRVPVPYDSDLELIPLAQLPSLERFLWPHRTWLATRFVSGGTRLCDVGLPHHALPQFPRQKHRTPVSIAVAFVATHNHFVLDRSGMVFKQTAPIIKLPATATIDDHLDLLGLLNSSTLAFWMRQVFQSKGQSSEPWEERLEYDSSKLKLAPITDRDRSSRIAYARALDATAAERAACLPAAVFAYDWTATDLGGRLEVARTTYRALTERMVALQEELDWLTYGSYDLIDPVPVVPPGAVAPITPGHRPFEIRLAQLDEDAEPEEQSAWWSRHGHDRVTEVPERYDSETRARIEQRLELIANDVRLELLETPAFKRRWQTPDLAAEAVKAAESWLLDRLEDLFADGGTLSRPEPYRLETIVAEWTRDPRVNAACQVFAGTANVDPSLVAETLLQKNSLSDNPYRLYHAEGIRKLNQWKAVWALQDQEDRAEPLTDPTTGLRVAELPLPPKFTAKDFQGSDAYSIRGKLNVPRERFIAFSDLRPVRYGWNGWRDTERALCQVEAYTLAEKDPNEPLPPPTTDDPRRCGPTVGLWESLSDLQRWGDAGTARELRALAEEVCGQTRCPCAVLTAWQAQAMPKKSGRKARRTEEPKTRAPRAAARPQATVEERGMVLDALVLPGAAGLSRSELQAQFKGAADRLKLALDELLASGEVGSTGRGRGTRYVRAAGAGRTTE